MSKNPLLSLTSCLFYTAMLLAVIVIAPGHVALPRTSPVSRSNETMISEPRVSDSSITSASWDLVTVRGPVTTVPIDVLLKQEVPAYAMSREIIEPLTLSQTHNQTTHLAHRSLTLAQINPEFPSWRQELEGMVKNHAPAVLHSFFLPTTPPPTSTIRPPFAPSTLLGKALVVDQDTQVLRVYEDGVEIRTLPASTGVPPLYTPAFSGYIGRYVNTIYGYGELADNAWYVFTAGGNIYIHGAPYTLSEGEKVYAGLEFLGVRPSSHGCIRLYPADAEWLTTWDPQGVPILITPLDLSKEW